MTRKFLKSCCCVNLRREYFKLSLSSYRRPRGSFLTSANWKANTARFWDHHLSYCTANSSDHSGLSMADFSSISQITSRSGQRLTRSNLWAFCTPFSYWWEAGSSFNAQRLWMPQHNANKHYSSNCRPTLIDEPQLQESFPALPKAPFRRRLRF